MTTVIEELDEAANTLPDRAAIEKRVFDWLHRIDELYHTIQSWLPAEFGVSRSTSVTMHEELQKHAGLPKVDVPVLYISRNLKRIAKIIPRGLWIVGSNGRLDLYSNMHFLIVDQAQNFADPDWHIMPSEQRRVRSKLTHDNFIQALLS